MPEPGVLPPGLERADSGIFKPGAAVFEPGAHEYKLPGGSPISPAMDLWSPPSTPADGVAVGEGTYQYMYNQLLYQYNTEVPYLRHQVLELTSKLAELDKWKLQTTGLVRDLRDQHRALRRKIGEDPPAPPALEQQVSGALSEAEAILTRTRTLPPLTPPPQPSIVRAATSPPADTAPQEFDAETGLKVYKTKIDGVDAMRADWKVNYFSTKLRGAMGRPVVSAPFDMHDMEEVRLMITPEVQESNTGTRTRKEKEQFSKMVTEGPLLACLTLKVPNSRPVLLKYFLIVGGRTSGPFDCDFSNTAIDNRGSFKDASGQGLNWLLEMKDSSVTVGVIMVPPATLEDEDEVIDVEMLKNVNIEEVLPDGNPGAPPGLESMSPPTEALTDTSGV